jgi:ubiquinol-cytochrome c reductase cytochrome b subunit
VIGRVARWVDDRLSASRFARTALNKVFPDHWSFMLGEVALYAFVVLLLTGVFLTFFFDPSTHEVVYHGSYSALQGVTMSEAYESTVRLSFDVRAGLVMRQIHHWAALVFIAAIVTHLCRVFFTGAFRRPRELNWMVGVTLLLLAVANGFTGYSMPDDLLSGTGLRIAYSIVLGIPVVGTWLAFLFFGGEFPATAILNRLFVIHIMIVPALIVGLLSAHMAILWRQKHTQFPGPGRSEGNVVGSHLWPTYAAKSVGLFCMVFAALAALGGLAQINPIWLYGPFRPAVVSTAAQPDWYVGWLEGALRIMPPWEIRAFNHTVANVFFPGVLLPGITFGLLYAWPFMEQRFTGDRLEHHLLDRPRYRPLRTAFGVSTLTFYGVLLVAGAQDLVAQKLDVSIIVVTHTLQALLFGLPVLGGWLTWKFCRDLAGADELAVRKAQVQALVRGTAYEHQAVQPEPGLVTPTGQVVAVAGGPLPMVGDAEGDGAGGRSRRLALIGTAAAAGVAWLLGRRRRSP